MAEEKLTTNSFLRHLAWEILGLVILAVGAAGCMKAAIGLGSWDAVSMSLSQIFSIPVGTIGMVLNGACVIGQILLLGKKFKLIKLLQFVYTTVYGLTINFFFYDIFAKITIDSYVGLFLLLLVSIFIAALGDAFIMASNMIGLPLEGLCMIVAEKTGKAFHHLRQGVDVVCLVISAALTLCLHIPWNVREGTVVWTLLFGPLLGFHMKWLKKPMQKWLQETSEEKAA